MPHIIVKLPPGQPEEQKQRLADVIAKDVMDVLQYDEESVLVEFEEARPRERKEQSRRPAIQEEWNGIYRKPGYEPY